jgi:hypothetical protein
MSPLFKDGDVYALLHESGVYLTAKDTDKWPFVTCMDPVTLKIPLSNYQAFFVKIVSSSPYTIKLETVFTSPQEELVAEHRADGGIMVKSRVQGVHHREAEWIVHNSSNGTYKYVIRTILE